MNTSNEPLLHVRAAAHEGLIVFLKMKGGFAFQRIQRLLLEVSLANSYELVVLPEGAIPNEVFINGSWHGLTGLFEKKEADVSFFLNTLAYDQSEIVEYSPAVVNLEEQILSMEKPTSGSQDVLDTIQRTDARLWILAIFILKVVSSLLFMMETATKHESTRNQSNRTIPSIGRIFSVLFGLVFYQSSSRNNLSSFSGQLLFVTYALTAVCIAVHISACVKTNLVMETRHDIDSFRDLLDSGVPVYMLDTSNIAAEFKYSDEKEYRVFWEKIEDNMISPSVNDFGEYFRKLRHVKKGKAAIVTDDINASMLRFALCGAPPLDGTVHVSKHPIFESAQAFVLRKSLPRHQKAYLHERYRILLETGLLHRLLDIIEEGPVNCYRRTTDSFDFHEDTPIPISGCFKIFLMLGIGLAIGGGVLTLELLYYKSVKLASKI